MASVTQKIPNYVMGMSTQPDEKKLPGQVVDLKNGLPDVTRGLIKRPASKLVSRKEMDTEFPGYAWDLLPFKEKPLDLYRAPMWHAEYNQDHRSPYAALQTSLGCQFACEFCMINIINSLSDCFLKGCCFT